MISILSGLLGQGAGKSGNSQIERFGHAQAAAVEEAGDQAGGLTNPVADSLEQGLGFGRIFGGDGFVLTAQLVTWLFDGEGQFIIRLILAAGVGRWRSKARFQ